MKRRGNLLLALVVSLTCFALLFVAAGVAISPVGLSQRLDQQQAARNAAESAIQLALAELYDNPDWGKDQQAQLSWKSAEGGTARLTFEPSDPNYSTNRIGLETPGRGSRGPVPPDAVQLIGIGHFGELQVRVLAVYHVPPFPYAVISTAQFQSGGNLLVGALLPGQDPANLLKPQAEELLQPAGVASQERSVEAVKLVTSDLVLGDLVSPGGIVAPTGTYRGKLRAGEQVQAIPSIDLDRFRPPEGVTEELEAGGIASRSDKLNLASFHHVGGSLSIPNGLNLDSGALYVDGDLTIEGGVSGKGLIVSKGKVTIHGGADLTSQNQLALLSKGSVTLEGGNQDNSFRGMVYTEGDLKADRVQIAGVLVANGKTPGTGKIEMSDTRLAVDPSLTFKANWLSPQSTNYRKNVIGAPGKNDFSATTHQTVEPQRDGSFKVRWNLDLGFSKISSIPRGDWNQSPTPVAVGKYSGLVREDVYDREGKLVSQKKKTAAEIVAALKADAFLAQLDIRHTTRNYRSNGQKGFYQYQTNSYSRSVDTEVDILDWIAQDVAFFVARAGPQSTGGHHLDLNFDLNQFLPLSDTLRILQWKQLQDSE
ncbi:MAG: hypothetical protein KF760_00160 [Candidatus Eremiobacteraeota bacterium]|nr:hypothetical protein [Candidatus Eremiobacteraeota bacterium]MCW5866624.1 hypothetical protein [Candidatus Eremiobacteraeota bacterium]